MASRLSLLSNPTSSGSPISSSPSARYSLPPQSSASTPTTASSLGVAPLKRASSQSQTGGQGSILERPYNKTLRSEVSLSAYAFLISETISYCQSRVDSISELEARLAALGHHTGLRLLSLLLLRNIYGNAAALKDPKKESRLIPCLQFIHTQVYRAAFGRPADGLEKSFGGEDEYMISLNVPPLTQHITVPKDMSSLSCEAFTAGLVEGVLDGLDFPAKVTAHSVPTDGFPLRSVVLIKLGRSVMEREESFGGAGR